MELDGKVAIVTGASGGIGIEIVKALLNLGMKVVGFGRNLEKLEELASEHEEKLYPLKVDMSVDEEITEAFSWISQNLGAIHVFVNNAGVMPPSSVIDGNPDNWRSILNTNILAVAICTKEAIKNMKDNDIEGHIVNIGSTLGQYYSSLEDVSVYSASKFAVAALTENLRLELIRSGTKIRTTAISPGIVKTPLVHKFKANIPAEDVDWFVENTPHLNPEDVADVVKYVVSAPAHVQICEVILRGVGEMFP